ncbi:bifunctional folylpolyglutamate synthase/dihydrofolate synthase [Qipengyuania sp. 6B39]|uniref:bifunctional folylpolyglutamate synthase/dihydrofolate synthase n=1 Tax=Qipengyuania proteolytica TaxID=2867239 RepID=UPI001C89219D|nr:folylpolyglutamate synthase/dihydrofolate synthase family protein [Qipengyuania proteolytica]MBX7496386.1 bifunctional folylpolyglutamate synthase/dihydrofolate synthase [Qipengyuania proteolytica]
MRDFARSDSPDVQRQLDRLGALSVPQGRLGLDTVRALLARLGDPHKRLPPVFHVAGTNGKGSTCAFLRAMLEAQGYRVHVTTSPHLVRYNERIRVAGELISDERLAAVLAEVLDVGEDLEPSFFEVTIAAAFLEFARVAADACVVEVGLGGRFDATNVLEPEALAACGIAALGIDHERFLLVPEGGVPAEPMARIAFEKAGIAKPRVPLVTLWPTYPAEAQAAIAAVATRTGAKLHAVAASAADELAAGPLGMPGAHQQWNAALAIAMLSHQDRLAVSEGAVQKGLAEATWPARLQRLAPGPLIGERETWLDGGHNRSAGEMLARHFRGKRVHLVIGMIEAKDPAGMIEPLKDSIASLTVVPVPGHDWHPAEAFGPAAVAAPGVADALASLPYDRRPVLIAGSLYLAGEVLRQNGEAPD